MSQARIDALRQVIARETEMIRSACQDLTLTEPQLERATATIELCRQQIEKISLESHTGPKPRKMGLDEDGVKND
jgi:hypothetical protein